MKDIYRDNEIYFRVRENIDKINSTFISQWIENINFLPDNYTKLDYTYYIVPCTWNGANTGTEIIISGAPDPQYLSNLITLNIKWKKVEGADYYEIYGREPSYLGLLTTIQQPRDDEEYVLFIDDGSYIIDTSKKPKLSGENETGRTKWDMLFFVPGKNLQSAELNDIQLINNRYLKNLGDTLFKEGDVVERCYITDLNEINEEANTRKISISDGKIYILGKVRQIPGTKKGQELEVPNEGKCEIGLIAKEVIVTANEDKSLKDPTYLENNYGKDGAVARVFEFTWVVDNSDMISIYQLVDGKLEKIINAEYGGTNFSQLFKVLAQRTYEESGNYVVKPFNFTPIFSDNDNDETFNLLSQNGAILYIRGNRLEFFDKINTELRKGRDVEFVNGEVKVFEPTKIHLYKINEPYVRDVSDLVAPLRVTEDVTKGLQNGRDKLKNHGVFKIEKVTYYDGVNLHEYKENEHFSVDGDYIDWSYNPSTSASVEPPLGVTYQVQYVYMATLNKGKRTKTLVEDETVSRNTSANEDELANIDIISVETVSTQPSGNGVVYREHIDYEVITGQSDFGIGKGKIKWLTSNRPNTDYYVTYYYWNHDIEGDFVSADSYDSYKDIGTYIDSNKTVWNLRDCIDFRTASTNKPIKDVPFSYDYHYYLSRIDKIVISENDYNIYVKEGVPAVIPNIPDTPDETFALYEVYLPPYTYSADDIKIKDIGTPVYSMDKIHRMNKRLENVEYFILLERLEKEALNYTTDSWKKGIYVDSFIDKSKIDFGYKNYDSTQRSFVAVNAQKQYGVLPFKVVDYQNRILNTTCKLNKDSISLPYIDKVAISQLQATSPITVQPFEVFDLEGNLNLIPSMDTWIDESKAPRLNTQFEGTKKIIENYEKLTDYLSSSWDSWRLVTSGLNINKIENDEKGEIGPGKDSIQVATTTDISTLEALKRVRSASNQSFKIDSFTESKSLGERVVDVSVIKYARQIPVAFTVDNLVPNLAHTIYVEGHPVKVYSINDVVGVDVPAKSSDPSYVSYINKFNTDKLSIHNDYRTNVVIEENSFIYPNEKGKASGFFFLPDNLITGQHKIEIKAKDVLYHSKAEAIFFTNGFRQTKQDVVVTMSLPSINKSSGITEPIEDTKPPTVKVSEPPKPPTQICPLFNISTIAEFKTKVIDKIVPNMIDSYNKMFKPWVASNYTSLLDQFFTFAHNGQINDFYKFLFPDFTSYTTLYESLEIVEGPLNLKTGENQETIVNNLLGKIESDKKILNSFYYSTFIQPLFCKFKQYRSAFNCWRALQDFVIINYDSTQRKYFNNLYQYKDGNDVSTLNNLEKYIEARRYRALNTVGNLTDAEKYIFLNNTVSDIRKFIFPKDTSEFNNVFNKFKNLFESSRLPNNISNLAFENGQLKEGWIRLFNELCKTIFPNGDLNYPIISYDKGISQLKSSNWAKDREELLRYVKDDYKKEQVSYKTNGLCGKVEIIEEEPPKNTDALCNIHDFDIKLDAFDIKEKLKYVQTKEQFYDIVAYSFLDKLAGDYYAFHDFITTFIGVDAFDDFTQKDIKNEILRLDRKSYEHSILRQYNLLFSLPWTTYKTGYSPIWTEDEDKKVLEWLAKTIFPDRDDPILRSFRLNRFYEVNPNVPVAFSNNFVRTDRKLNSLYGATLVNYFKNLFNRLQSKDKKTAPGHIPTAEYKQYFERLIDLFDELWQCALKVLYTGQFTQKMSNTWNRNNRPKLDPIAQSFFIPKEYKNGCFISGIGLYFATKGTDPVTVSLRRMKDGYPVDEILTSSTLTVDEINVSKNAEEETFFKFPEPVYVDPDGEICFSVYSQNKEYTCWKCTLGEPDIKTGNIILKQADTGTLFKSPNKVTWEMDGYSDLKYKLYVCEFTSNESELLFEDISITATSALNYSLFNFNTIVFKPPTTNIQYWYSTNGVDWKDFQLNENIDVNEIKHNLQIKAKFYGNSQLSPLMNRWNISTKIIKYISPGRYISKTIETLDNFTSARIIYKLSEPNSTNMSVYYSLDNGDTWIEITSNTATYIDGQYWEYEYKVENLQPSKKFKFKIEMSTNNEAISPKIKDIRTLLL